ncbi:hypothetical protein [Myroides odoratus]|uniref:hypothetical protein n=1 Tax=Myroides odoratus TaxID=256 RepID=UPI003341E92F
MKKTLTLLMFLLFITTSFANRLITIKNSSAETKYISAIDTEYFSFSLNRFLSYATFLKVVTLQPGQYITFRQTLTNDNETFPFCPIAPTPTNNYVIGPPLYPYKTFDQNDWIFQGYTPTLCNAIPPLDPSEGDHLFFRGFKILNAQYQTIDLFVASNTVGQTSHPYLNIDERLVTNPTTHSHIITFL